MNALRKIDHIVAESVWGVDPLVARENFGKHDELEYWWGTNLGHGRPELYTSKLTFAWKVVEKMTDFKTLGSERSAKTGLPNNTVFVYKFKEASPTIACCSEAEAALTICLLALEVLDVEVPADVKEEAEAMVTTYSENY